MKKVLLLSGLIFVSCSLLAQRIVVPKPGTTDDRFPKKSGSLRASAFSLPLGKLKKQGAVSDTIFLLNDGHKPIHSTIAGFSKDGMKLPDYLHISMHDSVIAPKAVSYLLVTYDPVKNPDYGFTADRFRLVTDDVDQPIKTFYVTTYLEDYFPAMSAEDSVSVQRARVPVTLFDYGTVKSGKVVARTCVIYNDGKRDLLIRVAKSNGPGVELSFSKMVVPPADSAALQITFNTFGKLPGRNNRNITVFMNDPFLPEVKLELKGVVE